MGRALIAASIVLASAAALGACASIWGFQDAHDLDAAAPPDPEVTPASEPGFVCVPGPPSAEWQSGLAIYETTTASAALPDCPMGYADHDDVFGTSTSAPFACNCACTPPDDACLPPKVTVYGGSNCSATPCASPVDVGLTCIAYPSTCTAKGSPAEITTPAAPNPAAKCTSTSAPSKPPPTFAARARTCKPPKSVSATCPADKVPTIAPSVDYGDYCITLPGKQSCPPTYPVQKSYFATTTDNRDCQCACGDPTGADCTTAVTAYDNNGSPNCAGPMHPLSATCSNMIGGALFLQAKRMTTNNGSCAVQGGPVGDVTTDTPTTICCRH